MPPAKGGSRFQAPKYYKQIGHNYKFFSPFDTRDAIIYTEAHINQSRFAPSTERQIKAEVLKFALFKKSSEIEIEMKYQILFRKANIIFLNEFLVSPYYSATSAISHKKFADSLFGKIRYAFNGIIDIHRPLIDNSRRW